MLKILVAEDEPGIQWVAGKVLEEAGYSVALARNGAEALDQMRDAPADCILLDWHMPVMDGKSFLEAWRAEPRYKKVPVVLFTSAADAVTIAASVGAQACISKPFELDAVIDTISNLLGTSETGQAERLIEEPGNAVGDADEGLRRPDLIPLVPPLAVNLRERARWTRQAIARSQLTILAAHDCLGRASQHIWPSDDGFDV